MNNDVAWTRSGERTEPFAAHLPDAAQIENALGRHPAVLEAIVTAPLPGGASLSAFLRLKPGIPATDDLRRELTGRVQEEVNPAIVFHRIYFGADLPKTRSGKIHRAVLEEIAAEDRPQSSPEPALVNNGS